MIQWKTERLYDTEIRH